MTNPESAESRVRYVYDQSLYNIKTAQKHFDKLLREAQRGKTVILARRNTPITKLVALPEKIREKATSRSK